MLLVLSVIGSPVRSAMKTEFSYGITTSEIAAIVKSKYLSVIFNSQEIARSLL